jgi:predicted DNA-binding transcriptional regulator AlpA
MRKLLTLQDLLLLFPCSEATLRRRHAETLAGIGNFPRSVNAPGKKLLFHPDDIERWMASQNADNQQPPVPESSRDRSKRHSAAMESLKQKGVILPSQK